MGVSCVSMYNINNVGNFLIFRKHIFEIYIYLYIFELLFINKYEQSNF